MSYSDEQLKTACNLIKDGTLTYGQAFEKFNIPISDFVSDYDRSLIAPTYRSQTDVGGVHK